MWKMKKTRSVDAAAMQRLETSAQACIQKDLTELYQSPSMKIHFPDPADLLNFTLTITPDEGMYFGGAFVFLFAISNNYPHEPPKVKCAHTIYHPNVDSEGNIRLNILQEDWQPVLNLNSVMIGLLHLLLYPNVTEPLNHDAAVELRFCRFVFARNVRTCMRGACFKGVQYKNVLTQSSVIVPESIAE